MCRQSSLRNANILAVVLLFLLAHTKNVVNCTSFAVPQSLTMGGFLLMCVPLPHSHVSMHVLGNHTRKRANGQRMEDIPEFLSIRTI